MASSIWPIRRTLVRVLMLVVVASPVVISTGCKSSRAHDLPAQEPETVGHRTGHPDYDEFFDDVYELKQQLKPASDEEKRARAPLGDLMGASSSETVDDLLRKTLARIDQFSQAKKPVRLELEGIDDQGHPLSGKAITVKALGRGRVAKEVTEFATALETTAKSESQIYEKYASMAEKARRLDNRADALVARLDPEFPVKAKREEVKQNIVGARGLLSQLTARADEIVGSSTKLLKGTADALIPAVASGKDRVVKEEKPKEREREHRPIAKASRATNEPARGSAARPSAASGAAMASAVSPEGASPPPAAAAPHAPAGDFNP